MDLIDREELLKRFELTSQANGNAIRYEIKCAPTVDAKPVRHGKWILYPDNKSKVVEADDCSVCGAQWIFGEKYDYCPSCGAKMDGE